MSNDPELQSWRRPPPSAAQRRLDLGVALGLFVAAVGSLILSRASGLLVGAGAASLPVSLFVVAGMTVPLAWRRSHPCVVGIAVALAFIAVGEARVPELTVSNIAMFMAIYSVGAWEADRRRATWVRGAIIAVMGIWLLTSFFRASTAPMGLEGAGIGALTPVAALMLQQILVNAAYFGGAYWFGNHAWNAARQRAIGQERAHQLHAERARLARQAVTIERLRIARELHDAVAHHVSLMGVQAAAARALLTHDVDAAGRQIESLEDSSRAAVAELYNLLGTLRDDEAADPDSAPGIDQLPDLVSEARSAGLALDLATVGEVAPLPPLVSLNLYRIAQESLTNVIKHAGPGAHASVRLRFESDSIELEVSDDGAGRPARAPGAGLGLLGMRERVNALAGTLTSQPRHSGGFVVRASVPLPASGHAAGPASLEVAP